MTENTHHLNTKILELLTFEEGLRTVTEIDQLGFRIVNNARSLVSYRQALLFTMSHGKLRLQAASSVSAFDPESPFVQWVETVAQSEQLQHVIDVQRLDKTDFSDAINTAWGEHSLDHVLWCPLVSPAGELQGVLWLARETVWDDTELPIIERIREAVGYSIWSIYGAHTRKQWVSRKQVVMVGLVLLVGFFLPVRMSVLAPVEVVAHQPAVVSAALDGVIASIEVQPNTYVERAQVLLTFDDTELRNAVAVAREELEVKRSQLATATQGSFADNKLKSRVAVLRSEIQLSEANLAYNTDRLSKTVVHATRDGLLIYSDPTDWIGLPVQVGQRIMQIADPEQTRFNIEVPVSDSLSFELGAEVQVFLNAKPLSALPALVETAAYEAIETTSGQLAFRVVARLEDTDAASDLRIGFRGTAKIYGERVPLFYYLFRRPLTAVRQYFGF